MVQRYNITLASKQMGAAEKNMCYILYTIRMGQSERTIAGILVTCLFVKDPFPPSLASNALLVPSNAAFF
jgi:hypothetical protein